MDTKQLILVLFLTIGICSVLATLKLTNLDVPESIRYGSTTSLILDCEYEVEDEEGLEVKWFHNVPECQIYQWLPTQREPQALGFMKDKLDVKYKASNNTYTMHRALYINQVSLDMSGQYTCKVSSYKNEETRSKKMIVYLPAKNDNIELVHVEDGEEVFCLASGLYPRPKATLKMRYLSDDDDNGDDDKSGGNDGEGDDDDDNDDNVDNGLFSVNKCNHEVYNDTSYSEYGVYKASDETYNVSLSLKFDKENLTGSVEFVCEIKIPGTNYSISERIEYYPENSGISHLPSFNLILLVTAIFSGLTFLKT